MYITFRGRVDSFEDTTYTRQVKQKDGSLRDETVQRYQLILSLPGSQEPIRVDVSPERIPDLPTLAILEQWELDESWVVATCDSTRLAKGSTDDRAWALVSFSGAHVQVMNETERKTMLTARRDFKQARKAKAQAAREAKKAAKQTETA
jgi:hypothetical protein